MLITRAPVRISFLGGATDYPEFFTKHGGAVLGTAIDKFSYIAVSHRIGALFEESVRVSYSKVEQVKSVEEITHSPFRECLRRCGVAGDVEVNYFSNLPAFTGLGSSSTFVVALLQALNAYKGRYISGLDLAYEAIEMERKVLGENVGCQDQTFAAMGGINLIRFYGEKDLTVHRIHLPPSRIEEFQEHLLVFFTGVRRRAQDIVAKQIEKVDQNTEHLRKMLSLVDKGYDILTGSGSLSRFGDLLHQSWLEKRSLDGTVSSTEIDAMYQAGLDAGALGGKLLGAGGGGFLLFFVPPESKDCVRRRLAGYHELDFRINAPGSQIISTM